MSLESAYHPKCFGSNLAFHMLDRVQDATSFGTFKRAIPKAPPAKTRPACLVGNFASCSNSCGRETIESKAHASKGLLSYCNSTTYLSWCAVGACSPLALSAIQIGTFAPPCL